MIVGTGCQGPASASAADDASAATGTQSESDDGADPGVQTDGTSDADGTVTDAGEEYGAYTIVASPSVSGPPGEYAFELVAMKPGGRSDLSFFWDFGDGELHEGTNLTYAFPAGGSYLVTVTAVTSRGRTPFVLTLQVEVDLSDQAPVARAGDDQTVDEGLQVCLDGSASFDPNDDPLSFEWQQAAGVPVSLFDTTDPAVVCFNAPDVDEDEQLLFRLEVSDGEHTTEDTAQVTVHYLIDPASSLFADAGPDQEVVEGNLVILDGSNSYGSQGAELTFWWTQTSGPQVMLEEATSAVARFIAPEVDEDVSLTFTLTIWEGELSAEGSVEVRAIRLVDPASEDCPVLFTVAAEGAEPSDLVEGPTPLTVTCTVSPVEGTELPEGTYTWLFDDVEDSGPVSTHAERDHVFVAVGRHTVGLMFTFAGATVPLSCVSSGTGDGRVGVIVTDPGGGGGGGGGGLPPAFLCATDADCDDDGLFCNGAETCVDAACQSSGDPCTDPALPYCDESSDSCVECLVDGDCDDGLFCTGTETCVSGACQSSDGPCTDPALPFCDETSDACVECLTDGNCTDGLFCNGSETCDATGTCQPGADPCPGQLCDEADDVCVECLDHTDCDDGLFCNGAETCADGACQAGDAVECNDGVACTTDSCDEATDSCVFEANDAACDNGLYCDGAEVCDPLAGCQPGDDPCPGQMCDEDTDTCFAPACTVDEDCPDDGNPCTMSPVCMDHTCVYPPAAAGTACGDPSDTDCDDPDTCNGAGTCVVNHEPDGTTCPDDGNDCTDDTCSAGTCTHPNEPAGTACGDPSDTDCDDPDTCNGAGTCVVNHEPDGTACPDDGNDCTDDTCSAGTCTHANKPAGTACGDPSDTDCDDPDTCNGAGACLENHAPDGTPCDDDLFCTGTETCVGGACQSSGDPCTDPALPFCDEDSDACVEGGTGGGTGPLPVLNIPTPAAARMSPCPVVAYIDLGRVKLSLVNDNFTWAASGGSEYYLQAEGGGEPVLSDSGAPPNNFKVYEKYTEKNVRTGTYRWTLSSSGTNEYYLEASGGGAPDIADSLVRGGTEDTTCRLDGAEADNDILGTMPPDCWGWGDNDGLGFHTLYVRLADETDPDTKADGYVDFTAYYSYSQGTPGSLAPKGFAWANYDGLGYNALYVRTSTDTDPDALNPGGIRTTFDVSTTGTSDNYDWHLSKVEWSISRAGGFAGWDDAYRYTTDPDPRRNAGPVDLSSFDNVQGFCMGWVLTEGNWTITVRVTNKDGEVATVNSDPITIVPNTRTVVTINSAGGADYSSLAAAVAARGTTDNVQYDLADGHTETVTSIITVSGDSPFIRHAGTGTQPVLSGSIGQYWIICNTPSENFVLRGLRFTPTAIGVDNAFNFSGTHWALVDSTFDGEIAGTGNRFNHVIKAGGNQTDEQGSYGIILNNLGGDTRCYSFVMDLKSADRHISHVLIGNQFGASSNESIVRFTAAMDYSNTIYNTLDFTNDSFPKHSLRLVGQGQGSIFPSRYHHAWRNKLIKGGVWMGWQGNLRGQGVYGLKFHCNWCDLSQPGNNGGIVVKGGAQKVMISNNIIEVADAPGIGGSTTNESAFPNKDVHHYCNTINQNSELVGKAPLAGMGGHASDFWVKANLAIIQNTANYNFNNYTLDGPVLTGSDDNVYSKIGSYAFGRLGTIEYMLLEWNALSFVGTDQVLDTALDANNVPSPPTIVDTPQGVHDDYYGNPRGATSWAGAVSEVP